jgi:trimethylamine--corrinoid protein Co-methyltransferase
MYQTQMLRDEHIEPIADTSLSILEQLGILCQNDELLRSLDAAGARVDYAAERVRFPRAMVEEHVASFRAQYGGRMYESSYQISDPTSEGGRVAESAGFAPPSLPVLSTDIAQLYYDWPSRTRRSSNTPDFITMLKLGEVLHGGQGVGHTLTPTDVPAILEPMHSALVMAEHVTNPVGVYCFRADQRPYLHEMGEALGIGDQLLAWGAICFAHPLRFDREPAARFVLMAKAGVPVGLTAMPVAGVSTPITPEGFMAMTAAEQVAGWIAARAVNPDVPLGGSMWAATVDMRSGTVSYSAPDAMYMAFCSIEFMRRWTGVSIPPGGGEYCDAKEPGLYAVLEKMYKAMMVAAFTGQHPAVGSGMLECGKTMSPVQLLLERDFLGSLDIFGREIAPTAANLAFDTMLEVDLGFGRNYFESGHTLGSFRDNVWLPKLIDREGWKGWDQDEALVNKAQAKFEDLLAEYRKPEVDPDKLAAMRAILDRAARDFGVSL